ncbi:hypothetical protein [Mesorhizobium onobrychidis]|uniref:hypothetical protein n=1 Tax=Mesorhizobium onobrychidis TaxID=2775404 RepID=UPI0021586287|nr:hypothetical protein [Mesorhizobium onobrychidis]
MALRGATGPVEGDRVYLVRTGLEPRGIVAFGTVTRAPYTGPHYDTGKAESGETTQFIDVGFTEVRDASKDAFLPLDKLQRDAPDQTWNPQSSGIEIKPKPVRALARLWEGLRPINGGAQIIPDATEPLNLILYGPQGTGKTYRLQQSYTPRYTDKDGDRFEFITFHQSYAYEDFIEGIRPVTVNGA